MVGAPPEVPVNFNEAHKRLPDEQVKARSVPVRIRRAVADGAAAVRPRGSARLSPEGHFRPSR